MPIKLPPLPYEQDALAPHMSAETLQYHYGKHHRTYVDSLNQLIEGKPAAGKGLEDLILTSEGSVFNNAAQVWNHTFFWQSMKPGGGGRPGGLVGDKLTEAFGSFEKFAADFSAAAVGQFGSGWAWLVSEKGKLSIMQTADADLPMKHGARALLTLDVWEHAYYLDHRNLRARYVETFLAKLVNWDFALENLAQI